MASRKKTTERYAPGRIKSTTKSVLREKRDPRDRITVNASPKKTYGTNSRWWEEPSERVWESAVSIARTIRDDQTGRRMRLQEYRAMYESLTTSTHLAAKLRSGTLRTLSYNVVRSCIDTAAAKIGKNKPRPLVLTDEGDWQLQQKAKRLTKYLDGAFAQMRIYDKGLRAFVDACIYDGGGLRFFVENDRVECERVYVDEIMIDEAEAYYGCPRQLHHWRTASRDVLKAMYPDCVFEIDHAPLSDIEAAMRNRSPELVDVIESWHLPSGPDAKDGRHTLCIQGATLVDEKYEKDFFPYVFYHWQKPLDGFWGAGIAEELCGLQKEINDLLQKIRTAQHFNCAPRIYVEKGSLVNPQHIDNDPRGAIIYYKGVKPVHEAPPALAPELYQQLETYYRRAFEISGISQMNAQATKPAGLDSGAALREFQDISSERFTPKGLAWEQFYVDCAMLVLDLSRDLYAGGVDPVVRAPARKFLEQIKWSEVDMEADEFDLKVFPVSMLPTTPEGRIQMITDLMKVVGDDGKPLISGEQAMSLLDFPDFEDFATLKTASMDDVRMILDDMLKGGDYMPPEKFMNLAQAREIAMSVYLRARRKKNVSDDNLAKLRSFMDECTELMKQAAMENAPPPPPPGMPPRPPGAPPGPGGPPPPMMPMPPPPAGA